MRELYRLCLVLGVLGMVGCQTESCPPGVTDSIFCRGFRDASLDGCVEGASCSPPDDLCAVGVMRCLTRDGPTCEVTSRLAEGDPCGGGGFECAADGTCSICIDGAVCNTGNPCLGGHQDCGASPPACIADTPATGQPCGTGGTCGPEFCSECIPGVVCNTGNPCQRGITRCIDDTTTECVADGNMPEGVTCGEGLACSASGNCDQCNEGLVCNTGNPCTRGHTDCGSGTPVCVADEDLTSGTGCGMGGVCSGAGECSECIDGIVCNTGNPCTVGTQTCPMGNPVCSPTRDLPAGVRCGEGLACDGAGSCSQCVPGDPCVTAACQEGSIDCSTGAPVCQATGPAPAGAVCRPRVDACDLEEVCDGSGSACPPDQFAPSGTACIDRGMCDGSGVCIPFCVQDMPCSTGNDCEVGTMDCTGGTPVCVAAGPMPFDTVCRPSTGECDAQEVCDGTSLTCPADADQPAGTACSAGVCDTTGMCVVCVNGAACTTSNPCEAGTLDCSSGAPVCVASGPATAGTLCRPVAGPCDVEEQCDGTTTACPPDGFDSTTECRASTHSCDAAEICDGTGATCPLDVNAAPGTICPMGVCSAAGTCDPCTPGVPCNTGRDCERGIIDCGSGAPVCQGTGPHPGGTVCRSRTSLCDAEEICDGTSLDCPSDGLEPPGTVCRAAVGGCDLSETCTGLDPLCPPDAVSPSGTTCRAAAGTCDAPEACDGVSNVCPPDLLRPSGGTCRPPVDVCDQPEQCTGTSPACPMDQLRSAGSICRMSVDGCDVTETCTGADPACPANGFEPLGTVCPSGVCDGSGGCSMCGGICPNRPNATTTCAGSCGYVCIAGYADCNGSAPDGCEIQTDTDTGNCGSCGNNCPVPANSNSTCVGAACGYACFPNFADCNGSGADGCEINTQNDIAHCGACGNGCPPRSNATTTCGGGACGFSCNGAFLDCNTNPGDGCEVDSAVDLSNCGSCGNSCPTRANASRTCASGSCGYTCNAGFDDCNGSAADGCEIDLDSTLAHCGSCGNSCPNRPNSTRTCSSGSCGFTCNPGFADCDANPTNGCEVNLNVDINACGACGNSCPNRANATRTCSAGSCGFTCNPGYEDCNGNASDGCEVFTGGDLSNCGSCGNVCPNRSNATRTCSAGSCGYTCNANFGDCNGMAGDGCETVLTNDVNNCGTCGNSCPNRPNSSRFCASSSCDYSCNANFGDCNGSAPDGCEVNLQSSVSHCGSCGNGCNLFQASEACNTGVCEIASCNSGYYDVDGVDPNGCECQDTGSPANCTTAENVGSIPLGGGPRTRDGNVPPDGGSDWYRIDFPLSTATFGGGTPSIDFTINDGGVFRFDIVGTGCGGSNPWCGGATGLQSWSIVDDQSDIAMGFRVRNASWPTTVWVRVYRNMSGMSCGNYRIRFRRP